MNKLNNKIVVFIMLLVCCFHSFFVTAAETSPVPIKRESYTLSNETIMKIRNMPFDNEIFKQTFQTLIYNSNISAAYEIALIAVNKRPEDLYWREKLAQTSTWVGDYNKAMEEWLYVVKHTTNLDTIRYAISIAKILGYDQALTEMLPIYIHQRPNDAEAYLDLAKAQNRINLPDQALLTLQKIDSLHPSRLGYVMSAAIYQDRYQWDNALKTWQKIDKKYGPDTQSVMSEAVIYYMKGDFKQAVEVLKRAIPSAKNSDAEYWQTLAELAWILNDRRLAILGYSHDLHNSSNLIKLIELEILTNPKQAYFYNLRGWNLFHLPYFLNNAFYLGQQLNQWQTVNTLLTSLSGKNLQTAQNFESFWEAQANLYAHYGAIDLQKKVLTQGIYLHPDMIQLKSDLLWLMTTNGNYPAIKTWMEVFYEQNVWQDVLLWHSFADGFDVLNHIYASIEMYQPHLFQPFQHDQILIDYANLLDKANLFQEAYLVRHYLWNNLVLSLNQQSTFNKEKIETISQIAPYIVSGTDQVTLFSMFTESEMNDYETNILLNWMVPRSYLELISYFKSYYMHENLPDWAEINLALPKNDKPSLQKIITHSDRQWPRADRINAAVNLENTQLANEYAFAELTDRPLANEIYTEFTQYGLEDANNVSLDEDYELFINLIGPRTKLGTKLRLTNEWYISPYINSWILKPIKLRQVPVTNIPSTDTQLGFKLDEKIHLGNIAYSLGYRKALNNFPTAALDFNYQFAARWTGFLKLGFNQECYQDSFIRIGGLQDQLNLGFYYNVTQRDLLTTEIQGVNYYSQNRHYLGNGYNLMTLLEHKIWIQYPDFKIGVFGNIYHLNRNGSFGGDITTLFPPLPPDQQSNSASYNAYNYRQVIPNSYNEEGIVFSFGDSIKEYTHTWRPYLWMRVYNNTVTHLSNEVKLGLNGTLLGRDSLLFYAERGTAQSVANQIDYMIGLRYMIYF